MHNMTIFIVKISLILILFSSKYTNYLDFEGKMRQKIRFIYLKIYICISYVYVTRDLNFKMYYISKLFSTFRHPCPAKTYIYIYSPRYVIRFNLYNCIARTAQLITRPMTTLQCDSPVV